MSRNSDMTEQENLKKRISDLFRELTPSSEDDRKMNIDVLFKMLSDSNAIVTDQDRFLAKSYIDGTLPFTELTEKLFSEHKDKLLQEGKSK